MLSSTISQGGDDGELGAEGMFGDINEKQEEYLQDILESGRHLLSLINDEGRNLVIERRGFGGTRGSRPSPLVAESLHR